ncbi:DNA polymerase III subunit delta [soil metagenome]
MRGGILTGVAATGSEVLGRLVLVTGAADFLAEREVAGWRAALLDQAPGADVTEAVAAVLDPGAFAELTSPSLFAASRGVVVRGVDNLPDDMHGSLVAYAAAPADDVAMVVLHPGGMKGKGLLDRLRAAGAHEVKVEAPKPWKLSGWITAEARRLGVRIDPAAADLLHRAVGDDIRALAAAVEQLCSDHPGARVDVDLVNRYYEGRAEIKTFDIAERAVTGDRAGALELLRWALGQRVALPLLTSAFAMTVRRLIKLSFAPAGIGGGDLAREVGCSPAQLTRLREQTRGWDASGLATALDAVAQADAAVKGGAADPGHAMERMVLSVVDARAGARSRSE